LLINLQAFAAEVKAGDCTSFDYWAKIQKVLAFSDNKIYNSDSEDYIRNLIIARCRMEQADTAFLWILFIFFIGTVALSFSSKFHRGGGGIV